MARQQTLTRVTAWKPWSPVYAASRLAGIGIPWHVAGGWAIDVWLGRFDAPTRPHEDLDVAVLRDDHEVVRARLLSLDSFTAHAGEVRLLPPGQMPPSSVRQLWGLDPDERAWRVDVMLEPGSEREWVFRRDERIRAPRPRMVGSSSGVPYLKPEGVLLFKAKGTRAKDEADFATCLPRLSRSSRSWLREALAIAYPRHPWIDRLTASSG